MMRLARENGQAAIELLGALPVLLLLGVAVAQLLAVGYAAVLAGNAAEAGALALAARADAEASAALEEAAKEHNAKAIHAWIKKLAEYMDRVEVIYK